MTSATDAARVEPLEYEGAPHRPTVESRDADTASGGGGRPATTGACDPRAELDTPADREGTK